MKRAYKILLQLYPRDFRAMFATEMSNTFEEASVERRRRGLGTYVRFALAELMALTMGAGIEWIAKLTTDSSVRGRSLPDRLLMRPPGVSFDAHYAGAFLSAPEELSKAQERTELLVKRIVQAISHHDFTGARRYSDEERQARKHLRLLRQKYQIHD
jgi:hypothetical protein